METGMEWDAYVVNVIYAANVHSIPWDDSFDVYSYSIRC